MYISPVRALLYLKLLYAVYMRVFEGYVYVCLPSSYFLFLVAIAAAMVWMDVCTYLALVSGVYASVLACYPCVVPVNNSFSRSTMFFLLFSLNFNWLSNEFAL